MRSLARAGLWASAAAGVFLAFAWPFAFGTDASSEPFHAIAIVTLVALLASIAASLAARR